MAYEFSKIFCHALNHLGEPQVKQPLVSGVLLKERFSRIAYTPLNKARAYTSTEPWVTVGVLVEKTAAEASTGAMFSKWRMADLQGTEVVVMMFGEAHKEQYTEV